MRILIQLFTLFALSNLSAQISFYKLYSGNGFDKGEGIVQLEDSSYVITGSSSSWEGSSQAFLLHVDSLGNYKWSNQYGGPESEEGKRVLYNKDLGFYIAGFSNSFGNGDFNAYLVKTNLNGEQLWEKNYGKPSSWERVNDAVMALDSGIVMVGETTDMNTGNTDILIIKTDKNGDTLWTRQLGGQGEDIANTIVKTSNNYLIGGQWFIPDSNMVKGFVLEMDDFGELIWRDTISDLPGKYVVSDISKGINKFYVAGYRINTTGKSNCYTGVYNDNGSLISHYTILNSDGRSEQFKEILFNQIKNKVAVGYYTKNASTFQDTFDVILAYFDPVNIYWMNQFTSINNQGVDEVNELVATSDGSFIAIGYSSSTGTAQFTFNGGSNIFAMKVGPTDIYPNSTNVALLNQLVEIAIVSEELKGKVYPNPFKDDFTIELEGNEMVSATLINNLGQQIESFDFQTYITCSTANLSRGTYFLKIGNSVTKLIKID